MVIWKHVKRHRWALVLAVGLNSLCGLAVTMQTMAPKYLIDNIILSPGVSLSGRYGRLACLSVIYLFISVVCRMFAWHYSFRIFARVQADIIRQIRSSFFRHINALCLKFHSTNRSGELFAYIFGTPLMEVEQFFHQTSTIGPQVLFMTFSTLLWVLFWDPVLTIVLLLTVFCTAWTMNNIRIEIGKLSDRYQNSEKTIVGNLSELIRGSRQVKIYGIEERVASQFDHGVKLIGQQGFERDVRYHMLWMRPEGIGYVSFTLLCIAATWRYLGGYVSIGEVSAYLAAFIGLQGPLNNILQIVSSQASAQAALARIGSVMQTTSTTPEPSDAEKQALPRRGSIVFDGVSFSYGEKAVFSDFALRIPYGQKIALVGPSGSGKSTLSQLAMRLYDPQRGNISVAGVNLKHCTGSDIRRCYGIVPQDPYFFSSSVIENVCLLKPDAECHEFESALRRANAWDFVQRLPKGADTLLGESGANLSGGQKQRLAIARALLANPSYFIFDEATSALDTVSEREIQKALEIILKDKTAIFIAHRLSTIQNCDRIIVLRNGQIEQDGTYRELESKEGLFQEMTS